MSVQPRQDASALDLAVRFVGAVTATIAAVRAAQSALRAWQRVIRTVQGEAPTE